MDGPLVAELTSAGAEVCIQSVPVVRKSMLSPRGLIGLLRQIVNELPRMRRLIKRVEPDVVLANTVTIPFWSVAARLLRRPVVVYVHEAEAALSRPARLLLTVPLLLANGVIFNSETSRRVSGFRLLEHGDRVRVVHNGVRGPRRAEPGRASLDQPFRVVYIGRLSPRKGVDLVVSAAKRLQDRGVPTDVDLVGAVFPGYEWYEAELREQVANLGLSDRVRFTGFQPAVWEHLAAGDVAVVPSRLDESFGNVVIEALLAKRPVVVADHTGLREAASGFSTVVLVPTDDPDAIADGLERVHDDWESYRVRAQTDAARADELYDPQRFQERLAGVLSDVATTRRRIRSTSVVEPSSRG